MTSSAPESVIEKIKKLLALGNDKGATEEEAATAMTMAQRLLARHNLDMSIIDKDNGDTKRVKGKINGFALYNYQRWLMDSIAEATFCTAFLINTYKQGNNDRQYKVRHWVIIGQEANVISCQNLFEYLNGAINRTANAAYPPPRNLTKQANSFREGISYRLRQRIKEQMEQDNQMSAADASAADGALTVQVLREDEHWLNIDHMYGLEPGTTKRRELEMRARLALAKQEQAPDKTKKARAKKSYWDNKDMSAFWAGDEAGKDISLNRQVDNHQTEKGTQ